jgi:hypothetical protein
MTRVAAPRELVERLLASPTVVTDPDLIAEWRALRGGSERAAEGELF